MSSSQTNNPLPTDSDSVMVEAPDSPPQQNTNMNPTPFSQTKASPSNSGASRINGDGSPGGKTNFGAPGSSWQTKKFNEEWQRATDGLSDKDWEPAKYGDPLMENNGFPPPK